MPFYYRLKFKKNPAHPGKVERTASNLIALRKSLDQHIEDGREPGVEQSQRFVRIATWNLRAFGKAADPGEPGRDFECLYYIAEIISSFDIVALQEVRAMDALEEVLEILGPDWEYLATDIVDGTAGNGERMAFLWNRNRARFRGIAGELSLPEDQAIRAHFGERIKLEGMELELDGEFEEEVEASTKAMRGSEERKVTEDVVLSYDQGIKVTLPASARLSISAGTATGPQWLQKSPGGFKVRLAESASAPEGLRVRFENGVLDTSLRQFARSPFLVSFQAGWLKLNLCTVHIYYGEESDRSEKMSQRVDEISALAQALAAKADSEFKENNAYFGILGDFNIVGRGHPTMKALTDRFEIPAPFERGPGSNIEQDRFYDQIAFRKSVPGKGRRLTCQAAGVYNFYDVVYREEDADAYASEREGAVKGFKNWRTYKMSDHLIMWAEFPSDLGEEYLKEIAGGAS